MASRNEKKHGLGIRLSDPELGPGLRQRPGSSQRLTALLVAGLLVFVFADRVRGEDRTPPFQGGEKLTYQITYCLIPAGEAVLEVVRPKSLDGETAWHFVLTARSYPCIDLIYKVRDRIEAYTDGALTHSLRFKKQTQEGRTRREVVVDFDWSKGEAQYANFGKKRKPVALLPGTFDPLSIMYAFRFYPLTEGLELEAPVTDGKKCVRGKARVSGREKITIGDMTYDTFLVEPDLKDIKGVFEKSPNAELKVWFTADERRIPVRIRSEVIVGSFVGDLVKTENVGETVNSGGSWSAPETR